MVPPLEVVTIPRTSTWMENGSFVTNKHTFSSSDMIQNLRKMNRLLQIQADDQCADIENKHKKQESIWDKGTDKPVVSPDLSHYPTDVKMVEAWEAGLQNAC